MNHFATLFDINYLSRGLAMMHSLFERNQKVSFYVLCLDNDTSKFFDNYFPGFKIICIQLSDLELSFPNLKTAKQNRTYVEYLFTLSPFLPLYILQQNQQIERITSLDADMYFFNDPIPLLKKYGANAILITPHYFPLEINELEAHGIYNVCFQSFPNDENGLNCLKKWASNCLEYCGDSFDEQGRYADQKYLDDWKKDFENVYDLPFEGFGLAPWNVMAHDLKSTDNQFIIDGFPLICYHFHNFRIINNYSFSHGLHDYSKKKLTSAVKKLYSFYYKKVKFYSHRPIKFDTIKRYKISHKKLYGLPMQWYTTPFAIQIQKFIFFADLRKLLYRFTINKSL